MVLLRLIRQRHISLNYHARSSFIKWFPSGDVPPVPAGTNVCGDEALKTPVLAPQIARRLKPEEEELLCKREELVVIRATLADRQLRLVDFRDQLAAFHGRYLREVGMLYGERDERKARIAHGPRFARIAQPLCSASSRSYPS